MSRPSADINWGGTSEPTKGCGRSLARLVLLVAAVLGLLGGGS